MNKESSNWNDLQENDSDDEDEIIMGSLPEVGTQSIPKQTS